MTSASNNYIKRKQITLGLLGSIAGDISEHLIFLANEPVLGALTVSTLARRGLVFCMAFSTFLSAALLHSRISQSATDRFFHPAFRLVQLARQLAVV